jgi:diadenosine tetraphosphate (Ap4A) HIT family hydrolase
LIAESDHAYSIVNLRPLKAGHVMVLPRRHVEHFSDLTKEESKEIFDMVEFMADVLLEEFDIYPIITINPIHARSEKHVHIHLVPSEKSIREFFAIAEHVPLNKEIPAKERIGLKERIKHAIAKRKR